MSRALIVAIAVSIALSSSLASAQMRNGPDWYSAERSIDISRQQLEVQRQMLEIENERNRRYENAQQPQGYRGNDSESWRSTREENAAIIASVFRSVVAKHGDAGRSVFIEMKSAYGNNLFSMPANIVKEEINARLFNREDDIRKQEIAVFMEKNPMYRDPYNNKLLIGELDAFDAEVSAGHRANIASMAAKLDYLHGRVEKKIAAEKRANKNKAAKKTNS